MACCEGYKSVTNPAVPFSVSLGSSFGPHRSILICGSVPSGADRFSVNLKDSNTADVHFHANVRIADRVFVRNTCTKSEWGKEEVDGIFPFAAGKSFQLEIRNVGGAFEVYTNGVKFCNYKRRHPHCNIDKVEIHGDVILSCMHY